MAKNKLDLFPLEFTNISVLDAPLLKDYYWEWLGVGRLNRHFLTASNVRNSVFNITMPRMPIYSRPLKIIMFVTNVTSEPIQWTIKRKKVCDCEIQSVPTGINTFKKGYVCPHRALVTLLPDKGTTESKKVFEIQMYFTYTLLGETQLSYELNIDGNYKLHLKFKCTITEFDPLTCVLTKYLFPLNLGNVHSIIQPIWLFNHYNQDMQFEFDSDETGLEIVTKSVLVKKYCLTALLVEYKPEEFGERVLTLHLNFLGIKNDFKVITTGLLFDIPNPISFCPKRDISTPENPYVIFENSIGVKLKITESSSTMIAVHNFSEKCVHFKWHSYYIDGLFNISVNPDSFACKPNHAQLCLVSVYARTTSCVFPRVPIACDVFKSIGEEMTCEEPECNNGDLELNANKQKALKRLWLNVNFRVDNITNIQIPAGLKSSDDFHFQNHKCVIAKHFDEVLFEKIFWSQIFGLDFLSLVINKKSEGASYEELFAIRIEEEPFVDRKLTLQIVRMLVADAVTEIAKHWRFIPIEVAYP